MSLLSVFRKNKQEPSAGKSEFYSLADEEKPARKRRPSAKRDEPVDPVLPEKKRARRRLVGAIALVLAVVIGLPMILDSEPKPLSDDIAIQIPSRDGVAPLAASKPAPDKKSEEAADALEPNEEIVQPAAKPAAAPTTAPVVSAAPAAPATVTTPAVTSSTNNAPQTRPHEAEKKPAAPVKSETSEPKHASTPPKADDTARARAILEGKTAANAPAPESGRKVAVQVAALATAEKVKELQEKLQNAGLKSYTQKVATQAGDRIRVRLGPFANDAEAEKARAKLSKIGLNGKLVPA
jgi:DedD protein